MCKSSLWLALGLAMLLFSTSAQAYTIGNPVGATGSGKLVMSLEYEYQDRQLPGNLPTESMRYLAKASYGLTSWLDLFAKGGAADLEIPMHEVTFASDQKFAWGAGARATLLRLPIWRAEFFSCGQIFNYHSRGRVDQEVTDSPQTWTRSLNTKYIWWEYGGSLGIKARQGAVWPYVGVDISYVEGEKNTTQYNIFSYGTVYGGARSDNFSSDNLVYSGFGGLDISLPLRYKLSFEMRGVNRDEISFSVGVSQRSP